MKDYKYLVYPGHVISKSDGDRHFISYSQLIRLYGVDPMECMDIANASMYTVALTDKLIPLRPQYDGNYDLTQGKEM
jgi:hypothetical protein